MKVAAGALLRDARERRRRTNDEVAKAIGVDPATLSRLEQGKVTHPPTPDVLTRIFRELGVSPLVFLQAWGYGVSSGTPAQPFEQGTPHAEAVKWLRELDNFRAYEVARFAEFQFDNPIVEVPVIVAAVPR